MSPTHTTARIMLVVATLFLFHTGRGKAQEENVPATPEESASLRPGGFFQFTPARHRSAFTRLPGIPNCCREFRGGGGIGFTGGILATLQLSERLELEGRLGYLQYNGAFREREETTVILDGVPTAGAFEHQLDPAFSGLTLAPSILWRPFLNQFRLHGGVTIGTFLSGDFEQREELVEPVSIGLFENNRRIRNEQAGKIPDIASFFASADLMLSWELPLNADRSLMAAPEIGVRFGLTNHVVDSTWAVDLMTIGVAVRYGRVRENLVPREETPPPPVDTVITIDTIAVLPITASIEAVGLDEEGRVTDVPTLRVEEFISTNMRPLLTYVFFDENSHTIPDRYVRIAPAERERFEIDRLHSIPVLPTYHHVLNIVGRRMREHPDEIVEVVGTNDGVGERVLEGEELSARRARAVRAYLQQVWGIDSARLPISTRDLPDVPSNPNDPDGVEENRRVELRSDSWEIVKPIITLDTLRLTNPPSIRISMETDAVGPLRSWHARVWQGGEVIREFSSDETIRQRGGIPVERLPREIIWNLSSDQRHVPRSDSPVTFELTVVDTAGRVGVSVPDTLRVEQITVSEKRRERVEDRYIDRYSLILFEFDSPNLGLLNERIASIISGRILPESEVLVVGQTDRIGDTQHNIRLSQGRALSTTEALGLSSDLATGEGENIEIYDNDLPEGRFYSRTVRVLVETPVNADSTDRSE